MAMALRCSRALPSKLHIPLAGFRTYATIGESAKRRSITVLNDDGRHSWSDLSTGEKAARTTQQTFNFGLVILGVVMTGGVAYVLYDTVFSSDSKTSHFNRAVGEIKDSSRARELLGPANKIIAYGAGGSKRFTRNREITSTIQQDGKGRDHLLMDFRVEGPNGKGVVHLHMVRATPDAAFEYKKLTLDVPGNATVFLRNTDAEVDKGKGFKFLGAHWR